MRQAAASKEVRLPAPRILLQVMRSVCDRSIAVEFLVALVLRDSLVPLHGRKSGNLAWMTRRGITNSRLLRCRVGRAARRLVGPAANQR